ncbi:MAG: hypothetical protein JWP44_881 [Mucilaginibacter sp.]|nr:hypothetical protein [Mucilaginibacter sp.]
MAMNKSNLGHPLTKEQQKQIKGGSGVCSTTQQFRCTCAGSSAVCLYGNGVSDTNALCSGYCTGHWPAVHTYCGDPACSGA